MSRSNRKARFATQEHLLLRERELADRWHKSLRTLQRWRAAGHAPPHIRIGSSILYRFPDVLAFEAARKVPGTDG